MDKDMDKDKKARLVQEILNARAKQQKLQIERITLSGALQGREKQWANSQIEELKTKTIPRLEKTIESLRAEKIHLVNQLHSHHKELDQIVALRADLKERRKEQVMHFHSDAVNLKHRLASLNRDIFKLLREEGVPESIIVEVYSTLQRTLPRTSSPSKMSKTTR